MENESLLRHLPFAGEEFLPLTMHKQWRCRSASQLPIEWITQILSSLSVAEKIRCRSVCKKWFIGAKHALEDQQELRISLDRRFTTIGSRLMDAVHFRVGMNSHVDQTLSHFTRLKKLTVAIQLSPDGYYEAHEYRFKLLRESVTMCINSLLSSNCETLSSLDIIDTDCMAEYRICFSGLKELKCNILTIDDICMLTKLRKLTVNFSSSLQYLPRETMTELNLTLTDMTNNSAAAEEEVLLLTIITRLANLKVLRISGSIRFPEDFKLKLLQNHRKLKVVSLQFDVCSMSGRGDDDFIWQLVATNPNLREIDHINPTEAGVRQLSTLNNLMVVTDLWLAAPAVAVPAAMHLLTGNSGKRIQKVIMRSKGGSFVNDPFGFNPVPIHRQLDSKLREHDLPFVVTRNPMGKTPYLLISRKSLLRSSK
jgi:hypothetical protein